MFTQNYTGVQESGNFEPMPEGVYTFKIGKAEEGKSQNGHNQVKIELTVNEGEYKGRKLLHWITFLPPDNAGAGISKHFLHAIGEEYEGEVEVNPENWQGTVTCYVKIDEYEKRNKETGKIETKRNNKIGNVYLPEDNIPQKKIEEQLKDVPF